MDTNVIALKNFLMLSYLTDGIVLPEEIPGDTIAEVLTWFSEYKPFNYSEKEYYPFVSTGKMLNLNTTRLSPKYESISSETPYGYEVRCDMCERSELRYMVSTESEPTPIPNYFDLIPPGGDWSLAKEFKDGSLVGATSAPYGNIIDVNDIENGDVITLIQISNGRHAFAVDQFIFDTSSSTNIRGREPGEM